MLATPFECMPNYIILIPQNLHFIDVGGIFPVRHCKIFLALIGNSINFTKTEGGGIVKKISLGLPPSNSKGFRNWSWNWAS
jgi:hypothetical protein